MEIQIAVKLPIFLLPHVTSLSKLWQKKAILDEVKVIKYYSIIVDSTPDISHVDQLTFIIRYVKTDGTLVERFLKFLPNVGHKSEDLETVIISILFSYDIELKSCRGQSYDNTPNISGCYSSLQTRILQLNPFANYVTYNAHSLNHVGTCAAECVSEVLEFFVTIQHIYTFFSASMIIFPIVDDQKNFKLREKVLK